MSLELRADVITGVQGNFHEIFLDGASITSLTSAGGGGIATSLASLSDVDTTSLNHTPDDGEVLTWHDSHSHWMPMTPPAGADGAIGPQGPAGVDGAVGPQGPAGADGSDGADGSVGPQGLSGSDGVTGPEGPQGIVGPVGPEGPEGPAGAPAVSPAGLTWRGQWASGTSYALNDTVGHGGASYFCINANSGTTTPDISSDFALLAAQGADGAAGNQGSAGPTGPQGPAGAAGAQGPAGPVGPQGTSGPAGGQGPAGPAGAEGPAGPTGPAGAQGLVGPAGGVSWSSVPASSTAIGSQGDMSLDANYLYICVSTDQWRRTPISTW